MFGQIYSLTATETALLVAVPVLLGSLARLPMGVLTDRFGGRLVFTGLLVLVAAAAYLVPQTSSYRGLLAAAFFIGLAGSSFAVGVGYVSRWTATERQGTVLGIYGLGTMGQSAAVFFAPLLASAFGWQSVFLGSAAIVIIWAVIFFLFARNAQVPRSQGVGSMLSLLATERLAWILGLFYFLTFGGFVAFSIYLPTLLRDVFGFTPADAGFRAAGFAVLATLMRPAGGWLADRMGGSRVLSGVFLGVIPFALLLAWPSIIPFTVGALGCAVLLGIGNGGVFKLVPQYFPRQTGTVTGLVGAMGGLGGFFPPLLLGVFRDRFGIAWPGFVLLAATSLALWRLNARVLMPRQVAIEERFPAETQILSERVRAGAWATLVTGILIAAIVVGSRNLQNFDAALVIYTFAVIFTTWGIAYHYYVWLQKPPTHLYWRRTLPLLREQGVSGVARTLQRLFSHIGVQSFIYKAIADALVDASAHFLGMSAGRGRNVPACLRLDPLRVVTGGPDGVCHLPVRFSCCVLPNPHRPVLDHLSRSGFRCSDGPGRRFPFALEADARSGRSGSAVVRSGLLSFDPAGGNFRNRTRPHRLHDLAARQFLWFHRHNPCHHGDCRLAVSSVWQVLPHLSAACATWSEALSGSRPRGRRIFLHSMRRALRIETAR